MLSSVLGLPLQRPLAVLRPRLTQFPRQASLTSAINRGIRKTQAGVDLLNKRTSTGTLRNTRQDSVRQPAWQAQSGDSVASERPARGLPRRSWNTEPSSRRHGRDADADQPHWSSDSVGRYNRAQGTYSDPRHREQDDYKAKRTPRSSIFDREGLRSTRQTGGQSSRTDSRGNGPNRRERRAAIFGTKTRSESSLREHNRSQTKFRDGRVQPARWASGDMNYNSRESGTGQEPPSSSGLNQHANALWQKPTRRARDGHRSWQEPEQDLEGGRSRRSMRRSNSADENTGSIFDETKQALRTARPLMRVPLSVPYTTAGSEFLYGTHVVKAALRSGRRKLYKLYIYEGDNGPGEKVEADQSIYKLALAAGVNVSKVTGDWERLLNKMSDQRPHNGYVLEASPIPKLNVTALEKVPALAKTFDVQVGHQSAEELAINRTFDTHDSTGTLPSARGSQRYPFLLMLDRIRDPGNLGSIIRSAYFLGAEAIVMIEHGTAPLGPVALKSSASAAEHLPLLVVKNEHAFIRKSQENGWKFFAAMSPDSPSAVLAGSKPLAIRDVAIAVHDGPCVLLLGSEEGGIRPQLQRLVNASIGIESGRDSAPGLDSLNVGVAAALLMQGFLHGSKRSAAGSNVRLDVDVSQPASGKVFEL